MFHCRDGVFLLMCCMILPSFLSNGIRTKRFILYSFNHIKKIPECFIYALMQVPLFVSICSTEICPQTMRIVCHDISLSAASCINLHNFGMLNVDIIYFFVCLIYLFLLQIFLLLLILEFICNILYY